MLETAAPLRSQHPDAVRIVDHHHGVVFLGQRGDLAHWRDIAVHAEDPVADNQFRCAIRGTQSLFQGDHVLVRVDLGIRVCKANSIDAAGVVQFLAEDCPATRAFPLGPRLVKALSHAL